MQETEEIVLTEEQGIAKEELVRFLNSDDLFHTLIGGAGTGKSTTLGELLKVNKFAGETVISAPTHKAKKVVEAITKVSGVTIHSLLGLRPNVDLDHFDVNNPQFDAIGESRLKDSKLVIIDEASMLSAKLHNAICKEARESKTKVLFVGDSFQLAAVEDGKSVALTTHPKSILRTVIRQALDNPIMGLLNALRYDIENGTTTFEEELLKRKEGYSDKGEGYSLLDKKAFTTKLIEYFSSPEFNINPNYCKFVAWTNKNIGEWNKYIRKSLFDTTDVVTRGDLLMSYNSISDQYNKILLVNSEDYKIDTTYEMENQFGYKIYRCSATSENYGLTMFDIIHSDSINDFLREHNRYLNTAKLRRGRAWIDYYKFKNQHLLVSEIKEETRLILKKDIDYGYGVSVHKTQGSTYENVFVNLSNINKNWDIIDRKRLCYVALSRCRGKCFILNS